jgi:hypothetical protein
MTGRLCGVALAVLTLPGCISALDNARESPFQTIEVVGVGANGQPRNGLKCVVFNDKGHWALDVPGEVVVRRSAEPLHFECDDQSGEPLSPPSLAAIDERDARAAQAGKRYGAIGAVAGAGMLGAAALGPAGLVYLAAGGAGMGGYMAWEKKRVDTTSGHGFSYPRHVELRFETPSAHE